MDIFYFHNFGYFPGKSFCFLIESALISDLDIFLVFDLVFAGDIPASTESPFIKLLDWNIFIDFDLVLICAGVMSASAEFLFVATANRILTGVSGLFVAPFDRSLPTANRILTGVSGNEGEELPTSLNLLFQGVEVI